jgi:hypothetical protein
MRFRSKVVEIDAWQFQSHAQFDAEAPAWLKDVLDHRVKPPVGGVSKDFSPIDVVEYLAVGTLEGTTYAGPGHWIIRGTEGELYPCKPSVFERKYEPTPSHPTEGNDE